MRKQIMKAGLIVAAAAMMMTGCGSESAKEETTAAVTEKSEETKEAASEEETDAAKETDAADLKDEANIVLGEYKGLTLTVKETEVTDTMVDTQIKNLATQYAVEVTDRAAELDDIANIDYVGTKDGVAFDGGTAEGYDLTLGSGRFIDGFEDGVVGMEVGSEKDLNLTFPENYDNEELAGQDVVFHVTLNALKSPVVDDSLAQRVLGDDAATLDALKEQVYENLCIQQEANYFNLAGLELVGQVIENSEITCDEDAVDAMLEQMKTTYTNVAAQYGITLEDYLKYFMYTDLEGLRSVAENMVQQEMVLFALVDAEGLEATDEQKDAIARMNFLGDAENMVEQLGEEASEQLFDMSAAYYYLMDHAVKAE